MRSYTRISADSHVEVPPHIWSKGVPALYRDMAPKHIVLPNGGDGFIVEGGIYQGAATCMRERNPRTTRPSD